MLGVAIMSREAHERWHRDSSDWFDFDHVILQLLSRNMQRAAAARPTGVRRRIQPWRRSQLPLPHRFLLLAVMLIEQYQTMILLNANVEVSHYSFLNIFLQLITIFCMFLTT